MYKEHRFKENKYIETTMSSSRLLRMAHLHDLIKFYFMLGLRLCDILRAWRAVDNIVIRVHKEGF